jgi:N-acetylglucosamine malate deacetylase 1
MAKKLLATRRQRTQRTMFGRRILIFVPRPGFEVVACGAAIDKAKAQGADVFAAYLTSDYPTNKTLWSRSAPSNDAGVRLSGAQAVAALLGITPLSWASRPAGRLWRELPQIHTEMRAAIEASAPDQIWISAYEGSAPDNDGLNALGQLFSEQLSVLEFSECNFFGGKLAQQFPFPDGSEQTIVLDSAQQQRKRYFLSLYASEGQNLEHAALVRECYRPQAVYDYSQPPHPGRLWYADYRRLLSRRSRSVFARPTAVSQVIVDYLEECWRSPPLFIAG